MKYLFCKTHYNTIFFLGSANLSVSDIVPATEQDDDHSNRSVEMGEAEKDKSNETIDLA